MAIIYIVANANSSSRYSVKIGYCTDSARMRQRLSTLQIGNPEQLAIFRTFEVSYPKRVERAIHEQLHRIGLKVRGEWFDLTPEQAVKIVEKALPLDMPEEPPLPSAVMSEVVSTEEAIVPKRRPTVRRRVVMDEPEHVMLDRVPSGALWAPQPEKPWNVWTQERQDVSRAYTRKLRDAFVVRYGAAKVQHPELGEAELKAPIHADHAKLRREANLQGEVHDYKPYSCGGPEHDIWYCPKCRVKAEAAQAMPASEEDEE